MNQSSTVGTTSNKLTIALERYKKLDTFEKVLKKCVVYRKIIPTVKTQCNVKNSKRLCNNIKVQKINSLQRVRQKSHIGHLTKEYISYPNSLRAHTSLCGVVPPCYQTQPQGAKTSSINH